MTLEEALAEIARLKKGIKTGEITMIVDGGDMMDHGWMTHRDHNLRMEEERKPRPTSMWATLYEEGIETITTTKT